MKHSFTRAFILTAACSIAALSAAAQAAPTLAQQLLANDPSAIKDVLTTGKATPEDVSQLLQILLMNTPQGTAAINLDNPATLSGFVQQLNQTLKSSQSKGEQVSATEFVNKLVSFVPADMQSKLISNSPLLSMQLQYANELGALAEGVTLVASLIKETQEENRRLAEVAALTPLISQFKSADGGYLAPSKQHIVEEFDQPSKQWRQFSKTREWSVEGLDDKQNTDTDEKALLTYMAKQASGPHRQAWASAAISNGSYIISDSCAPRATVSGSIGSAGSFWPVISQTRSFANTSSFDFSKDFSLKVRFKALHSRIQERLFGFDNSDYTFQVRLYGVNVASIHLRKQVNKSNAAWHSAQIYGPEDYQTTSRFGRFKSTGNFIASYVSSKPGIGPKFDQEWMELEVRKVGTQLQYSFNGVPVLHRNGKPMTQNIGPIINRYQLDLLPGGSFAIDRVELQHL